MFPYIKKIIVMVNKKVYQAERELKELLSGKSSFTMLCRSIPAVRFAVPKEFFD